MISPCVISLDLDDTLWPVTPVLVAAEAALLEWLRAHHPRAAHGLDLDSMRGMRARIAERFPEQSHDMTFLRRRALDEQFAAAGYAGAHAENSPAAHAMEIFLAARNRVKFYDDVRPALERLRTRARLFAVSNGNADLARCGIADLFDGHVTAANAGAAKPDARIFAHLVRIAGVEPAEVLHIGDDPLADVVGARRAGLQAVWINRDGRRWPDELPPPLRTVSTLAEIM
ncbi:MAG: HAD family hydrolase [Steroidobacteraceae bacterium]|jgi:putative hydrolase of the HAD superfamily